MTTASELTQPDVARLMGLVSSDIVKQLIRAIGNEVHNSELSWQPFRGSPDTFGPSLAGQLRNGRRLSNKQIGAAKGRLLQRNWTQVKHVLIRGLVTVPGVTLESATEVARLAPTYTATRGAGTAPATAPVRPRTARLISNPAPAPVASVCGMKLAYTYDGEKCTRPKGHPNGCIGERSNTPTAPTQDVDSVLAGLGAASTPNLPGAGLGPMDEDAARERRFALVFEAAWDDEIVTRRPAPEGYVDPSVRRFQLLDLD